MYLEKNLVLLFDENKIHHVLAFLLYQILCKICHILYLNMAVIG